MKARIIVAAIFIPILFVILLFLPPVFTMVLVALISVIASFELMRATGETRNIRLAVYAAVSSAAIVAGYYFKCGDIVFRAALTVLLIAVFAEALIAYGKERPVTTADITMTLFAGAVLPFCYACLVSLKVMENGRFLVFFPFIVTMISDGGAYFAGVYLGKHKAFPKLSPKKTVEGCLGGLASSVVFTLLYGLILKLAAGLDVSFPALLLYGFAGNIVTQLGDLSFSFIKREHNIKDYGNLLPGHGGMLDRFDSMVFGAPIIYLLVVLVPVF